MNCPPEISLRPHKWQSTNYTVSLWQSFLLACVSIYWLGSNKHFLLIQAKVKQLQHSTLLLCLNSECASFEGPSLWGLAFGAFPGFVTRCFTLTSRFLLPRPAKVTIYATRCRHFLSFFLLFRGHKESWVREATKDNSRASSKSREKNAGFVDCIRRSLRIGTAFERRSDVIGPQMLLWRMQTLNWDTAYVTKSEAVIHHIEVIHHVYLVE